MTRTPLALAALAALGLAAVPPAARAQATLASSTFNINADGWTAVDLPGSTGNTVPITQNGGPFTPVYSSTGGNPGGFISQTDPDANSYYWYAPSKFLGNEAAAVNGTLSFDEQDTVGSGSTNLTDQGVILVGSTVTVSHSIAVPGTTTFTNTNLSLAPSGWINVGTGAPASAADMQSALSSLQSLYILGDIQNGGDTGSLDNVFLSSAPEPSQFAAFGVGLFGLGALALKARRRMA